MDLKIEHFQNCHDTATKATATQRNTNHNSYKHLNGNEINMNDTILDTNPINKTEDRLEKYYKKSNNNDLNGVNDVIRIDDSDKAKTEEDLCNDSADDFDQEVVKCIFLCKFHATAGPKIAAQVPNNYISKEIFDTVSRYVIPKVQLQRSFLSV